MTFKGLYFDQIQADFKRIIRALILLMTRYG